MLTAVSMQCLFVFSAPLSRHDMLSKLPNPTCLCRSTTVVHQKQKQVHSGHAVERHQEQCALMLGDEITIPCCFGVKGAPSTAISVIFSNAETRARRQSIATVVK